MFRYFLRLVWQKHFVCTRGQDEQFGIAEGVDENQNTFFWGELDLLLLRQGASVKISRDTLREYDEHICRYVKQIGKKRGGIKLKYFQYIACLFTEMYLDRFFTEQSSLCGRSGTLAEKVKKESLGAIDIEPFTPENMNEVIVYVRHRQRQDADYAH